MTANHFLELIASQYQKPLVVIPTCLLSASEDDYIWSGASNPSPIHPLLFRGMCQFSLCWSSLVSSRREPIICFWMGGPWWSHSSHFLSYMSAWLHSLITPELLSCMKLPKLCWDLCKYSGQSYICKTLILLIWSHYTQYLSSHLLCFGPYKMERSTFFFPKETQH